MGRLSLIIADNDTEYLANFEKFLLINYPQRFELFSFFSEDKLSDFLTHVQSVDILIISRHICESGMKTAKAKLVLLLTENSPACQSSIVPDGIETVHRYQHMDKLVSEIIRLYSDKSLKNVSISGHGNTRIIGVLSPSGGTGSSSIAAGCSILCAGKGIRSFYLNMETIPSTDLFFYGDCSQTFSNVIYYLKGKYGNLQLRLEGAKCIDSKSGVHYFKPPENIQELSELSDLETATLLNELKRSAFYRYIFIDMSAGLSSVNSTIIKQADAILLVLAPDQRTSLKLKNLKAGLDILEHNGVVGLADRIIPILNRSDAKNGQIWQQILLLGDMPLTHIVDCSSMNAPAVSHVCDNSSFLTPLNGILENILFRLTNGDSQHYGGEHIA